MLLGASCSVVQAIVREMSRLASRLDKGRKRAKKRETREPVHQLKCPCRYWQPQMMAVVCVCCSYFLLLAWKELKSLAEHCARRQWLALQPCQDLLHQCKSKLSRWAAARRCSRLCSGAVSAEHGMGVPGELGQPCSDKGVLFPAGNSAKGCHVFWI